MALSLPLVFARQILIIQKRWWDSSVHSMSRDSIVRSEDSANQLVFDTSQGLCTFTLRFILCPYIKWNETFLRREQLTGKIRSQPKIQLPPSSCTQVALPHLISQDRAHNVIRLHWKYSKHGRHVNLFVPGWQTTSECPGSNYTTCSPRSPLNIASIIKPIHPGFSF
jgi:hypothetical protein